MTVEKAKAAYAVERLNCAQSILRAFQESRGVTEEQISAARQLGGGRAENGVCGALSAASSLVEEPQIRERLRKRFVAEAGSEKCREIRKLGRLTCEECVLLAATLLDGTGKPESEK